MNLLDLLMGRPPPDESAGMIDAGVPPIQAQPQDPAVSMIDPATFGGGDADYMSGADLQNLYRPPTAAVRADPPPMSADPKAFVGQRFGEDVKPPAPAPANLTTPAADPQIEKKPFWNPAYSPAQRWMMLGAALRDAGASLDGRDTTYGATALKSIDEANTTAENERVAQQGRTDRAQALASDPRYAHLPALDRYELINADAAEVAKARLKALDPYNLPMGDQRTEPTTGETVTAPRYGVEHGVPYEQTPQDTRWGKPGPPGYDEETDRARVVNEDAWRSAELKQPRYDFVGTNDDGQVVAYDTKGSGFMQGGPHLNAKPGTARPPTKFEENLALLAPSLGGTEGAARFLAKTNGAPVSMAQANHWSDENATERMHNGEGAGDPDAFRKFKAEAMGGYAAYNNNVSAAPTGSPPPAAGPFTPPAGFNSRVIPPQVEATIRAKPAGVRTWYGTRSYSVHADGKVHQDS